MHDSMESLVDVDDDVKMLNTDDEYDLVDDNDAIDQIYSEIL